VSRARFCLSSSRPTISSSPASGQFQGNGGWFLPIPATLVVGIGSEVKARFVDPDFRHRMRMEDILQAVRGAAKT